MGEFGSTREIANLVPRLRGVSRSNRDAGAWVYGGTATRWIADPDKQVQLLLRPSPGMRGGASERMRG